MKTKITFDSFLPNRYAISLKENTRRHAHLFEELEKADIKNLKLQFSKKFIFKDCFKNTASRSITNAHLNIHQLIKKNNKENAMVVEDDVCFVKDFKKRVEPILEDLKTKDWDIMFFYRPVKGNRSDYDADRGEILEEYSSGLLKITGTINSHAYAVNINSIDKITNTYNLDFIKTIPKQIRLIDKSISMTDLNFYGCNEDFIFQDEKFPSATAYAGTKSSFFKNLKLYFKPIGND